MENFNGYYAPENAVANVQGVTAVSEQSDDTLVSENDIYSQQLKAFLPHKRYAHPLIVLALMIMCFPIGLMVMLLFTKWGAFPKTLITIFVLAVAVAIYEILVAKQVLLLPSLIDLIVGLFTAQ